jgi:hypothetical protein
MPRTRGSSTQHIAAQSFEDLATQIEACKITFSGDSVRDRNAVAASVTTPIWDERDRMYHVIVSCNIAY